MKRGSRITLLCFLSVLLFFTSAASVRAQALGICSPEQALTHTCTNLRTLSDGSTVISADIAAARGYTAHTEILVMRGGTQTPFLHTSSAGSSRLTVPPQELCGARIVVVFSAVHNGERHSITREIPLPGQKV